MMYLDHFKEYSLNCLNIFSKKGVNRIIPAVARKDSWNDRLLMALGSKKRMTKAAKKSEFR
jgi:hypothetical protein